MDTPKSTLPAALPKDDEVSDSELLTNEEYELMLGHIKIGPMGTRNRHLLHVLRHSGLRISEVLALTPADIRSDDQGLAFVYVTRLKKRSKTKREPHYVKGTVLQDVYDYARHNGIPAHSRIFPFNRSAAFKIVRKIAQAALGRSISPKAFRKLFVTDLADKGVPIETVAHLVGHTNPVVTFNWYRKLTSKKRAELAELT